jgi:transposase
VPDGTIEIITGRERRRRWGVAEKLRIVAESQESGVRVCDVAARHDVYPSLLHGWRRLVREGQLVPEAALNFVPVRLAAVPDDSPVLESSPAAPTDRVTATIEIVLPLGGRVLIRRDTPVPMLRAVIQALRG